MAASTTPPPRPDEVDSSRLWWPNENRWSILVLHVWTRGVAQASVPHQVEVPRKAWPDPPQFQVKDRGLTPVQEVQIEHQAAPLRWEIERQVSSRPEKEWETHYRSEPYPAWLPYRLPGSKTESEEPDPLLVVLPSQMLFPMLEASERILLLRRCSIFQEEGCKERLNFDDLPWLCLNQAIVRVELHYPVRRLPDFPLVGTEEMPHPLQAVDREVLNSAYKKGQEHLGWQPYWAPVLQDPTRVPGYPL